MRAVQFFSRRRLSRAIRLAGAAAKLTAARPWASVALDWDGNWLCWLAGWPAVRAIRPPARFVLCASFVFSTRLFASLSQTATCIQWAVECPFGGRVVSPISAGRPASGARQPQPGSVDAEERAESWRPAELARQKINPLAWPRRASQPAGGRFARAEHALRVGHQPLARVNELLAPALQLEPQLGNFWARLVIVIARE